MTLLEALRDPNLFARFFRGRSWLAWRVFLAALFAETVDEAGLELYRECTGRDVWPKRPFTEACLVVGRRGGKSRMLALIATYLACFIDYAPYLAPGEVCTVAVLASDRAQARTIFRFVVGLLKTIPLLRQMIVSSDSESIVLNNRVVIEISTASFRATRGYTYGAVLADELAFWHSDEWSLNPDTEILRAVRPGLTTIPGAMLLIASSPYARRGELFNLWRRHFGHDDGRVLVWQAPTITMNPKVDRAIIDEAYADDPASARAEYGAQFRDDLIDYVSAETIDALTMWGRHELPPMAGVTYAAFCDPSGGRSDAMTLAIGHLSQDNVCVLDLLCEARPPFEPETVVKQFADELRRYGIASLTSDKFGGDWVPARFAEHGIELVQSARPKSDLYVDLLPILHSNRAELLDHPRLARELTGLERRTGRSGRDSVDHQRNHHDDLANAAAGLLVGLDLDRRPALVKLSDVTGEDESYALPDELDYLFLTIVDVDADVAAIYCGSRHQRLYILDVEATFLRVGLYGELTARLRQMTLDEWHIALCRTFAPEHLRTLLSGPLTTFEDCLTAGLDPDELIAPTSEYMSRGLVRFGPTVRAKMTEKTIAAALTLKGGDKLETALRTALVYAAWIEHGGRQTALGSAA